MAKNPLIRSYPKKVNAPLQKKSAGILEDHVIRKNVATKEGTIEHVPSEDNHIANKKYVDDTAGGGAPHAILDGSTHTDSDAQAVSRGSIIAGDATPEWTELTIGANGEVLTSDGTDITWGAAGGAHDLLSATHGDTDPQAVTRGSIMIGDATPEWTELVVGGAGNFLTTDGTDVSWADVKLDDLANPSGNTAFTMDNKQLKFSWTAPAVGDGAFELEATGGFSGDLVHIHQHTGNPGATDLVHLEYVDTDVLGLRIKGTSNIFIFEQGDGTDILTLNQTTLAMVGDITVTGTVDGVDIAGRDHAEAHTVASHSDTTGTGAELDTLTDGSDASGLHVHTVVSLDTDTTGAELTTLGDNSMADALHRHSELSASDGTPDAALSLDADGVPTHTTDMDSNDTLFIPNIWHGTDGTPPAANTCPRGTLYIKYTA